MSHEEKARQNLRCLIRVIDDLFLKDKVKFDLVLASGDSGYSLKYILDKILDKRGVKSPPSLILPYYRYTQKYVAKGNPFDNKNLAKDVELVVKDLEVVNNTLFIDDEIGEKARTISGLIDLVKKAKPSLLSDKSVFYVVAEDHGFDPSKMKSFKSVFKPFSKKEGKINNAISYLVPKSLSMKIKNRYGEQYPKELINWLLNLPVKDKNGDTPYWSYDTLESFKKDSDFRILQKEFQDHLDSMINEK
ncbi:MAG: hypothetical protein Q8P26_03785 [Candidatus Levybacteria bacterium]|nr:hypothetical protein [Candidatus Levybacteria bacterium]